MQYFMIAMIVIVFGIFLILMIENCRRVRDGKRLMREIDDLTQCGVHKAVAIKKAEALLRSICGEENYQEYMHHGGVSTNIDGWHFWMEPERLLVKGPSGHYVSMCVHTSYVYIPGPASQPADEVVIKYLGIKHDWKGFVRGHLRRSRHSAINQEFDYYSGETR